MDLSKNEIIDRIRHINRSAKPEFLGEFDERQLQDYLKQLENLHSQCRYAKHPAGTACAAS